MPTDPASIDPTALPAEDPHAPPAQADLASIQAAGKVSEALEWVERARGRLYDLHQMIGHADLLLDDAVAALHEAGHDDLAQWLQREVVGRNVLRGRWTFQIVEEFDDGYYAAFRAADQRVREQLMGGARHVFEALLKEARRTHGARHHECRPGDQPETSS